MSTIDIPGEQDGAIERFGEYVRAYIDRRRKSLFCKEEVLPFRKV